MASNWLMRQGVFLMLLSLAVPATAADREDLNQALARRYYDAINNHAYDRLDGLVSTWVVHHDAPGGEALSAKQFVANLQALQQAFPDFGFEVKEMIASGNKVAVRYRFTGTQRGEIMGVAPTSKKVSVWAVDLLRIEEGKVREIWGTPLTETLRQALQGTKPGG